MENKRYVNEYYCEPLGEMIEGHYESDYVWTLDSPTNIKIITGEDKITITFGDEYSQQLFMESVRKAGFKKGQPSYGGEAKGNPYYHPKSQYYCGVWLDEQPGKCILRYVWTY